MKTRYKVLITLAVIIALVSIAFAIFFNQTEKALDELKGIEIHEVDLSSIPDGTYEGEYKVFPIHVILNVSVRNHEITGIDLIKHDNGQGAPAEALLDEIVKEQKIDLDAVSGASYSSRVILLAVEDALNP